MPRRVFILTSHRLHRHLPQSRCLLPPRSRRKYDVSAKEDCSLYNQAWHFACARHSGQFGRARSLCLKSLCIQSILLPPAVYVHDADTSSSSVPSFNDVLVPETLLKKRKTDSKLREENQAKALELRKVCIFPWWTHASQVPSVYVMYNNHVWTRPCSAGSVMSKYTIFRG